MREPLPQTWQLQLPSWVDEVVAANGPDYGTVEAKMRLAIALSEANITSGAGGPFGAAIFDKNDKLISVGINLVFASGASLAHGEMVALTLAQAALNAPDLRPYELTLVTSAEPCAMCLGALPWSGVCHVVCGASDADIRSVGFDEGAKPEAWVRSLQDRGISVQQSIMQAEAKHVLLRYMQQEGKLY